MQGMNPQCPRCLVETKQIGYNAEDDEPVFMCPQCRKQWFDKKAREKTIYKGKQDGKTGLFQ